MEPITRPVLRWHGGKYALAPWIISHFPPHRVYCEPFAGAASVLLRKPRSNAEVINDLYDEVVNVFRVLRDPAKAQELADLLRLTPYARTEFECSFDLEGDAEESLEDVEQARRVIVRSFQAYQPSCFSSPGVSGFRPDTRRRGNIPARLWAKYPGLLSSFTERLAGVVIECRPATQVMHGADTPGTLHYLDPPYVASTRSSTHDQYAHEMTDEDHTRLAEVCAELQGMIVLSGYPSALYERLYGPHGLDWARAERDSYASSQNGGQAPRTECLWLNPAAQRAHQNTLFSEVPA